MWLWLISDEPERSGANAAQLKLVSDHPCALAIPAFFHLIEQAIVLRVLAVAECFILLESDRNESLHQFLYSQFAELVPIHCLRIPCRIIASIPISKRSAQAFPRKCSLGETPW